MKKILFLIFLLISASSNAFFEVPLTYHIYKVDKPAPTIIVGHHCGGATGHSDDWARQLNKWGYNAVNLDSFTPRKITEECKFARLPAWQRTDETYRLAEFIKQQSWHKGKIGYIGFSHGGSTAVYIATDKANKNIDASVAFYPYCGRWGGRVIFEGNPRIKLMMALAGRDDWTPPGDCMTNNKDVEIHLYENATHSFDQNFPGWTSRFLNYTLEHDVESNINSRVATRIFFRKYLEGIVEDDKTARAEFIPKAVLDSKTVEPTFISMPGLSEPTEDDIKSFEIKNKKPQSKK
jgi:dienelactone hydrolase